MEPKITFVVPCYKLAHLLPECIRSILRQSYTNFEIIIMDDCSPDNTEKVSRSFKDQRVVYVKNKKNMGHLENYNIGIEMASGKYVWLISADDCLRSQYVLQRYVNIMENQPDVGFVFCSAIELANGKESKILDYSCHAENDTIFEGKTFLNKLLDANGVVAASAMARKECYVKYGMFPLDLPYAGDWYLWSIFSMENNVAYINEPMVYYRQHNDSMTSILGACDKSKFFEDEVRVLGRIREKLINMNLMKLAIKCSQRIAEKCVSVILSKNDIKLWKLEVEKIIEKLQSCDKSFKDKIFCKNIAAMVYIGIAEELVWRNDFSTARINYKYALKIEPKRPKWWAKYLISMTGKIGLMIRRRLNNYK